MKKRVKHIWTTILGFGFILLGIIGLAVPSLSKEFCFYLIGLYLLSKTSPLAKKLLELKFAQLDRPPAVFKMGSTGPGS